MVLDKGRRTKNEPLNVAPRDMRYLSVNPDLNHVLDSVFAASE